MTLIRAGFGLVCEKRRMESHAKLLGHPIHPMLVVFPLGLLGSSLLFDILYASTQNGDWSRTSYWTIAVGIITALIAAVFGLVDWLAIPSNTRAKRIGAFHGLGNVVVVGLFAASWLMRRPDIAAPPSSAIILCALGVCLALVTGWLGGELVDRLGVGVDDNANLNAPSSLTTSTIRGRA